MLNDKEKGANKIETLIGEKCKVIGTLQGDGLIKIDGCIQGDVTWQDDIIIGVTSHCKSNVSCKNALISGTIEGNVICENTLQLEPNGKIKGDLTVRNLVIKEGGTFEGKCTMLVTKKIEEVLD